MISIILPSYNEGQNLVTAIDHIKPYLLEHELIVIDVSDQADSIQTQFTLMSQYSNEKNLKILEADQFGRSFQMNQGAKLALGNVFLFLHCDTKLPEDWDRQILEKLDKGYQWGRFDIILDAPSRPFRVIEFMINMRSRLFTIATGDQSIFVTRKLFKQIKGFPEIALMEDIAISKILSATARPALIRSAVITSARRWQNKGIIKTILMMWLYRFLFWIGCDVSKLAKKYSAER